MSAEYVAIATVAEPLPQPTHAPYKGDYVGDHGVSSGFVGLLTVALFFFVLLGGSFRRRKQESTAKYNGSKS